MHLGRACNGFGEERNSANVFTETTGPDKSKTHTLIDSRHLQARNALTEPEANKHNHKHTGDLS